MDKKTLIIVAVILGGVIAAIYWFYRKKSTAEDPDDNPDPDPIVDENYVAMTGYTPGVIIGFEYYDQLLHSRQTIGVNPTGDYLPISAWSLYDDMRINAIQRDAMINTWAFETGQA